MTTLDDEVMAFDPEEFLAVQGDVRDPYPDLAAERSAIIRSRNALAMRRRCGGCSGASISRIVWPVRKPVVLIRNTASSVEPRGGEG